VWNKFLLSPVEMRDFIDQCDSEYVGAYFDTGNIVQYGFPEQWIQILGQRIRAVHLKDFRASTGTLDGFVMLMEGDVNWPEVMGALREIDYRRALTAEYGPYQHSLETMLRHVLASEQMILAL
jgi:hexulose-6-phosphate isomerase